MSRVYEYVRWRCMGLFGVIICELSTERLDVLALIMEHIQVEIVATARLFVNSPSWLQ
jgi:hypothetical protein